MCSTKQHKIIALVISIVLTFTFLCGCSSKHVETHYEENENSNIQEWGKENDDNIADWDSVSVTWDDVEDYSDWVYSQVLFDDITDDFPVVECRVCDYRSNGQYFDGEKVYELVGDKFDVNSLLSKYAVGSGVILICVVLNVATAGGSTPIVCFIAGAAEGATSYAVKGAAFGAAIGVVKNAIKSQGDIEDTFYGALEDSADGYMWGAIFGAIEGGWNSEFCFTEDTLITTSNGKVPISKLSIGDNVYSYNEKDLIYEYNTISKIYKNTTTQLIEIKANNEIIKSTPNHPFLTDRGWIKANDIDIGDIIKCNSGYASVESTSLDILDSPVSTYNLCINNCHTYLVGENQFVVHNTCLPNEKYAGSTYYWSEGTAQSKRYPNGVSFNSKGYPDFSPYAKVTVKLPKPTVEGYKAGTCLKGNCSSDFRLANKAAGLGDTINAYSSKYPGTTWHHCEDMQTMMLVPQDVHSVTFGGVAHGGGESRLNELWGTLG